MSWTDERVETLKKLWQEGHSASQIAKQLGGVTRNAVIGKVHRLGLSGRAAPSQPARPLYKPAKPPRAAAPEAARPQAQATPVRRVEPVVAVRQAPTLPIVPLVEGPGTATVLTLGAKMCKWPIGDPSSDEFTFCGRRADDGIPYCVEHSRVAYQPQQKKKKDGVDLSRSLRRYL
ncbi:cell cycle sigma 70 cofactor GcrA [Asticcacaulis endophyticus]|jgi:GcrA cell cycle regulator|uniref:Cell cycle regulatory protein GcrA n=1 Tax=Asticcacaulis endophyticus TaxID=1395890 RepID=A0A918UZ30_9CAUL|nr:GcrA family cell cycle regulator [Asticcacaulis endophyticus]GGZ45232.1 cell cycle regulatory protein GcrA [Asticcacaulis endophyticus]